MHPAFRLQPLDGKILQLLAIGRLGNNICSTALEQRPLLVSTRRHGEAQEHRHRIVRAAVRRRVSTPVLEVTVLTPAGVEQGPKPIGRLRRGGRRHPEFAKQGVAQLESTLVPEAQIGGEVREDVRIDPLLGGSGASRQLLEILRCGEIRRWRRDLPDPVEVGGAQIRTGPALVAESQTRNQGYDQDSSEALVHVSRPAALPAIRRHNQSCMDSGKRCGGGNLWISYLKTESGAVRLSDCSIVTNSPRFRSATARSKPRVWAINPSMAASTTALPSALPSAIIWS